jgi:hypothetical protein
MNFVLVIHHVDAISLVAQSHIWVHVLLEAVEGLHCMGLST